jgi:hypothetical protein
MASGAAEEKIERLREAGFIVKTPLPAEYEEFIDGLDWDQIGLIIDIKVRLDDAEAKTAAEVGPLASYILGPVF